MNNLTSELGEVLALGAEAQIILVDHNGSKAVLKNRISKKYRLKEIDDFLISKRTKQEVKIMKKLKGIAPELLDYKDSQIIMEYLQGFVVRDILNSKPLVAESIGKITGLIHDQNIIHGDLTTSNMIFQENKDSCVRLIDFGLSFISDKIEDKAVDLHLFKEAVESKHFAVEDQVWTYFLKGYNPSNKKEILKRLEKVELRGKNKH